MIIDEMFPQFEIASNILQKHISLFVMAFNTDVFFLIKSEQFSAIQNCHLKASLFQQKLYFAE